MWNREKRENRAMYYVMLGNHAYHCIRFTGEKSFWADEQRPCTMERYNYDDEVSWTDDQLSQELDRVSGSDYDPFAMAAIYYEQLRRKGGIVETYDDWNRMIKSFAAFSRKIPE